MSGWIGWEVEATLGSKCVSFDVRHASGHHAGNAERVSSTRQGVCATGMCMHVLATEPGTVGLDVQCLYRPHVVDMAYLEEDVRQI